MSFRRLRLAFLLSAAVLLAAGGAAVQVEVAHAKKGERSAKAARAKASKAKKRRAAARKKRRARRRRGRSKFSGHGVKPESLRTEPLPKPSGDIWIYAENFQEEVKVNIYNPDGSFNEEALAELDRGFRCKRTREERAVDPRLYEALSIIQDHYGGERISLVSGFRFQQNEGSRHYHASAMDIRVPGVSARALYRFAESLDTGGMGIGIYPRSGFVHIDYRAPGEPSYRWTDRSGPDSKSRGKRPSRQWKRKPSS